MFEHYLGRIAHRIGHFIQRSPGEYEHWPESATACIESFPCHSMLLQRPCDDPRGQIVHVNRSISRLIRKDPTCLRVMLGHRPDSHSVFQRRQHYDAAVLARLRARLDEGVSLFGEGNPGRPRVREGDPLLHQPPVARIEARAVAGRHQRVDVPFELPSTYACRM